MEIIPQLISRYSVVLYAVCGIACFYFLLTGMASLRELRRAVFRLERSTVVSRAVGALLKAILCLGLGLGIFIVTMLAPVQPASGSLLSAATSTPVDASVPTSMPTAVITAGQALVSDSFTPTITFLDASGNPTTLITGTVAGAVTDTAAASALAASTSVTESVEVDLQPDCTNNNAQITSPAAGEAVVGATTIRGTAAVEAGGWYKLEILVPGTVQWAMIGRGDKSVANGVLLNNFPAGNFAAGVYPFRLALIGSDGSVRAVCRMPLTIGS